MILALSADHVPAGATRRITTASVVPFRALRLVVSPSLGLFFAIRSFSIARSGFVWTDQDNFAPADIFVPRQCEACGAGRCKSAVIDFGDDVYPAGAPVAIDVQNIDCAAHMFGAGLEIQDLTPGWLGERKGGGLEPSVPAEGPIDQLERGVPVDEVLARITAQRIARGAGEPDTPIDAARAVETMRALALGDKCGELETLLTAKRAELDAMRERAEKAERELLARGKR